MRLAPKMFGLQRLGFVVVFALFVQILAPIGGVWAATAIAADPLAHVPICSGLNPHEAGGTDSSPADHGACCPLCAVAQPASLPANPATGLVLRSFGQIAWVQSGERLRLAQARTPLQARAPPSEI